MFKYNIDLFSNILHHCFACIFVALSRGKDNFVMCPDTALSWGYRKDRIFEELSRYQPHILCLEEVDFYETLKETMAEANFKGIFKAKPDSPCLYTPDNMGPDGCAMFYKEDKLELLHSDKICLTNDSGYKTNQVAIICEFKLKGDGKAKTFFTAVTHLKAKSGYEEVRHQQGKSLLKYLQDKVHPHPMIVCGDFNGSPTEPVYSEFKNSSLNLISVYSHLTSDGQEVAYTTWKIRGEKGGKKSDTCKTIDYMWYSKDKIMVSSILDIPSEEEIGEGRLPSMAYPSDHLSLVCDISIPHLVKNCDE